MAINNSIDFVSAERRLIHTLRIHCHCPFRDRKPLIKVLQLQRGQTTALSSSSNVCDVIASLLQGLRKTFGMSLNISLIKLALCGQINQ